MKTLVFVEHDNASVKDATLAAVTAAAKLGEVHALVAGSGCGAVAEEAAKIAGVTKVHVADDAAYANQLAENVAPLIASLAMGAMSKSSNAGKSLDDSAGDLFGSLTGGDGFGMDDVFNIAKKFF